MDHDDIEEMEEAEVESINYGHKKRNGEFVLPKKVVEYHGMSGIRRFVEDAEYGMEDLEEAETRKNKGSFSVKQKTKTVFSET